MDIDLLTQDAKEIRKIILQMHYEANSGHIASSLSCVDILVWLYGHLLQEKDRFILSKGHAASALYATLYYYGKMIFSDFNSYYQNGTRLTVHPNVNASEDICASTGSLGHGLPIACGMAYASQHLKQEDKKYFCLLSDGECNEGSIWEAALFAHQHKLKNLSVLIDANGLQGFGKTKDVLDLEPFLDKWEAFGFEVREVEGHDFVNMNQVFSQMSFEKPQCVILRTIKGKGVGFMENELKWHYLPLTLDQYQKALSEIK